MTRYTENRCLLTNKGEKALKNILDRAFPNANNQQIIDKIGIDKKAITNILNVTKSDRATQPVSLRKLGEFFEKAFNLLDPISQAEYRINYPNLRLIDANPSIDQKYCNYAELILKRDLYVQQIASLLLTLDYREQEGSFKQLLPAKAIAVSIAAPSELTQQWLMHRLSRLVYEWGIAGGIPEVILLKPKNSNSKIKTSFSQWTLTDICAPVAKLLKIEDCEPNRVIQELAKYNIKHPVFIKVCGLHNALDRKILIEQFWRPLTTQISKFDNNSSCLSYQSKMSPLIMFLLESCNEERNYDNNITLNVPCVLEPLQIDVSHVQDWIFQKSVNDVLVRETSLQAVVELHDLQAPRWSCWQEPTHQDKLHLLIENLCQLFLVDCTLIDVSEHWKI